VGLSFGGVQMTFDGTPAAGDNFVMRTSQNTTVFQALQDVITALNAPIDSPAGARSISNQMVQNSLSTLQQAQNSLLSTEATMGSTLAEIQSVQDQDNNVSTADQVSLGNLQGGNLPQVIMQFNEGVTALQAAQAAYSKISGLSLFNYF
jgi:flagellar hook-associated protein 3 FlgL